MVVIRLSRVGKKNSPSYRVLVADKQRAVKRKFIEVIGHYNPTLKPKELVIDKERALFWMKQGAQPSDTVRNLMADLGILKKSEKTNKKYAKPNKKKAAPEEDKKPEATVISDAEVTETEPSVEAKPEPEPEVVAETVPENSEDKEEATKDSSEKSE